MKIFQHQGFTLLETVIASSVLGLVMVAAMGSWMLFMYKSNHVNTQASLDMDVRNVIERFRFEMRNASRKTVIFYPENQAPYKAVGFALASDQDGDGLMDMDAAGSNILWRQTVVYHVWDQAPTQMRRTVFNNRNNSAAYGDYYGQIQKVVLSGNGAGACLSGESAETTVLFSNLFTGKLWHAESTYDTYAATSNTLERLTFGSLSLGPGAHAVNFTVTGKNSASSGRKIAIDQISAGVSGWPLEAEYRTASGSASAPAFVGPGLAGAGYGLKAATAADGDQVALTLYNDAVEECEFIGLGRNVALSNTVVRFDITNPPSAFPQGVYATALDGRYAAAWKGGDQSGDGTRSLYFYPTNCVIRIPILSTYVTQNGYGPVLHFYKSAKNNDLKLENPMYAVVDSVSGTTASPDVDTSAFYPLQFYQDGVAKSNWTACTIQKYVDLRPAQTVPISLGSTLIVSFQVRITAYKSDCFTAFDMKRGSAVPGCWAIPGGGSNLVAAATWSTNSALQTLDVLPTLEQMAVGFADGGEYVSHPFDTRSSSGAIKTFSWDSDVPAGSSLLLYARSGNALTSDGFGISDAAAWANVGTAANGGTVSGSTGRYIQFRAVYTSQAFTAFPGDTGGTTGSGPFRTATPRLRRAFFTWDGDTKYVDIVANLLTGPDGGIIKVDVDGKPLIKGVSMEIEIFKDVLTQGGLTERVRSAMMTEVEPRNNDK